MKIEIKNKFTGVVIHEADVDTIYECVKSALEAGKSLYSADLRGADLSGADLSGADLSVADLRGAALYWPEG